MLPAGTESDPEKDPVIEEYARLAARYDRRWSHYVHASIRETLRRLDLEERGRLLDVGCGTGSLLQAVAARYRRADLAGTDPSGAMLALAREKLSPDVTLREGRAEALPFADQHFDTVISTSVFHFCRRPADALNEMRRVLRAGGLLLITDWCDDYWTCKVCNVLLRVWSPAHYRTYTSRTFRGLLLQAGFADVTLDRYKIDWLWGLMTARALKA